MPAQMIEFEEVTMVDLSDDALEVMSGVVKAGASTDPYGGGYTCGIC
jgi:hypothetical protein